ncbi:MAG: hypothetical protein ACI8RZ_001829 [Myxococcota bacterium]|jgi:hypothetical protein
MIRAWQRFWFQPAPARRIAVLRIAVGLYLLHLQVGQHRPWLRISRAGDDTFSGVGLASLLSAPLDVGLWGTLLIASIVLNVVFILGIAHRFVAPVFAVLLAFVLGYRNSWGQIYHVNNLAMIHAGILALAPAAHAWSVDAWLAGRRRLEPLADGWQFGWGIRLMSVATVSAYFLAGVAKVTGSAGWRWALGSNLRDQIAYDALYKELIHPDGGGQWVWLIYDHPGLLIPGALLTLTLELTAPLALLHRRLAWVFAIGMWLAHLGIDVLMTITFPYPLLGVAFLSFFAVEVPLDWARGWLRAFRGG